jgi:hypothetical protein
MQPNKSFKTIGDVKEIKEQFYKCKRQSKSKAKSI